MSGIIKKIKLGELVGWDTSNTMDVYPVTSTSAVFNKNNKSLDDLLDSLEDWSEFSKLKQAVCRIYKSSSVKPSTPTDGSYDFNSSTLTPPTGWAISGDSLEDPVWMCIGTALSNTDVIEWSVPTCISGAPAFSVHIQCYVAVIYKNSPEVPATPTGGSYDFSSKILTAPDGWSKDGEIPVNEDTYCSIRAFYSDNTETEWSEPSKQALGVVTLTGTQLEAIADNIEITANELRYIAKNVSLSADELQTVANYITLTTDQLEVVADNVDISGSLSAKDITLGGGTSTFSADGSGSLASDKITWATDGSGTLAGESIKWDADGNITMNNATLTNANVSGEITATSGTIGGLTIGNNSLINKSNDAYILFDTGRGIVSIGQSDVSFGTGGVLQANGTSEYPAADFVNLSGYALRTIGGVQLRSLPTSDPGVADALWNDCGTLKISLGTSSAKENTATDDSSDSNTEA